MSVISWIVLMPETEGTWRNIYESLLSNRVSPTLPIQERNGREENVGKN